PIVAEGTDANGQLKLTVNRTALITTKVPYKRVSVGQPEVADVNPIGPGNILVTAKKPGTTQVIIWDDADRSQVVDVVVEFDLQALRDQIKLMFPESKIEVNVLNGAIALRGRVANLEAANQAVAIAQPYSDRVLNFLEISGGQQVMLQVRFAEVSRSATSALGINGNYASGAFYGGSNIGQVNPSDRMLNNTTVGQSPPFNGLTIDSPTPVNPSVTLYGGGQIGNFYLEYFINALRQNNLLRVLAEPNLITISGQEASFLAGGEFPIPVTQGGGQGGVAITVEYREFGVKLKFVPVVLGDGRIKLKVAPEVSDLDFTTAVRLNGFVIPGVTTRKVETSIEMAEGQTFAIAGLLNNNITASKDVTPLLGDLPVVGALFRSVRYQRKETELVVLVTPRLVSPMNPDQVPLLPGEKWRDPGENDLFWNRDLGGEQEASNAPGSHAARRPTSNPAAQRSAARFVGRYGFTPHTPAAAQ
ncbi:MAG TPA: type II and III secretion system protein family protein, partial [Tepidisphaeraceae bacterium]|nr:type II and III secretion system protein family protein [Tepidisphaeraceae bacterium]